MSPAIRKGRFGSVTGILRCALPLLALCGCAASTPEGPGMVNDLPAMLPGPLSQGADGFGGVNSEPLNDPGGGAEFPRN